MKRQVLTSLAFAVVVLGVALALKWGERQGLVDHDVPMRWTMILTGLMLAFYANAIPKSAKPAPSARVLTLQRVSGWTMVLAGLAYAAVWAFIPMANAADVSSAAVGLAVVWVIGFCLWTNARQKADRAAITRP